MDESRLDKYQGFTDDEVDVLGYGLTAVLKDHNPNLSGLPTIAFITFSASHCAICSMAYNLLMECGVLLERSGRDPEEGIVSETMDSLRGGSKT